MVYFLICKFFGIFNSWLTNILYLKYNDHTMFGMNSMISFNMKIDLHASGLRQEGHPVVKLCSKIFINTPEEGML